MEFFYNKTELKSDDTFNYFKNLNLTNDIIDYVKGIEFLIKDNISNEYLEYYIIYISENFGFDNMFKNLNIIDSFNYEYILNLDFMKINNSNDLKNENIDLVIKYINKEKLNENVWNLIKAKYENDYQKKLMIFNFFNEQKVYTYDYAYICNFFIKKKNVSLSLFFLKKVHNEYYFYLLCKSSQFEYINHFYFENNKINNSLESNKLFITQKNKICLDENKICKKTYINYNYKKNYIPIYTNEFDVDFLDMYNSFDFSIFENNEIMIPKNVSDILYYFLYNLKLEEYIRYYEIYYLKSKEIYTEPIWINEKCIKLYEFLKGMDVKNINWSTFLQNLKKLNLGKTYYKVLICINNIELIPKKDINQYDLLYYSIVFRNKSYLEYIIDNNNFDIKCILNGIIKLFKNKYHKINNNTKYEFLIFIFEKLGLLKQELIKEFNHFFMEYINNDIPHILEFIETFGNCKNFQYHIAYHCDLYESYTFGFIMSTNKYFSLLHFLKLSNLIEIKIFKKLNNILVQYEKNIFENSIKILIG